MSRWWLKLPRYALPYWRGVVGVMLLMFLGMALGLLSPWPLKLIVDCVLTGKPLPDAVAWIGSLPGARSTVGLLAWLASGTVAVFLANRVVNIVQSYVKAGVGSRMVYGLGADLFDHLQRQSLLFHAERRAGDLVRRVTSDAGCVRELLIIGVFLPIVTSLATLVAMFVIMWQLSPMLSLLALLVAAPLGMLTKFFAKPMTERKYRENELQGELMSLAEQALTAIPLVQAFGREEHEDRLFRTLGRRNVRANLRTAVTQQQFIVGTGAVTSAAAAGVMVFGGVQVLQGSLAVGSLLVLLYYFAALYSPLETLAYLAEGFASAAAGARRVLEVFGENGHGVRETQGARLLPSGPAGQRGHVQFKGVTFGYRRGERVLKGVTLEARPGETVALVGATGAGKSTLVSLIPRFFDPWEGSVIIDSVNVRQVQLSSLRAQVSIVLQEPFLLPLTIAENIAYGRPRASREAIVAAAVTAQAHDYIQRLPNGYDTVIGERGATLSGGEKQRLSIARALLKDAPILILDEPTSALDAETEKLFLKALKRLMQGRTTFIIAHRLSTIKRADRVVVLENGKVVVEGSH